MGWGTGFKADVYISRINVKNVDHAQYLIDVCQENIDDTTKTLIGLAVATPHKSGDETLAEMVNVTKSEVEECVGTIIEETVKKRLLELYIDSINDGITVNVD